MAITTTGNLQITPASGLLTPMMAARPLQTALENLNYLWKWHRPALVDVCPTWSAARGYYVMPVAPSQDDLPYTFETRLWTLDTHGATIVVQATDTYAGGSTTWTTLFSATATTTADALLTHVQTGITIPHTTTALRWVLDGSDAGNYPHHLLVYPSPGDAVAGIRSSGFIPFDDGLLAGTSGAAVNTEYLNRAKRSALALLADRKQQAISFLVKESGTPAVILTGNGHDSVFQDLPAARIYFPGQGPSVSIKAFVLAGVSGGSTSDMVRITQLGAGVGALDLMFPADGAIHDGTLQLQVQQGPTGSPLDRYADIAVGVRTIGSNVTFIRAVSGYWIPGA